MRVEIKDSESFDQLLRRFQKGIERSGIIREHRRGLRGSAQRRRDQHVPGPGPAQFVAGGAGLPAPDVVQRNVGGTLQITQK